MSFRPRNKGSHSCPGVFCSLLASCFHAMISDRQDVPYFAFYLFRHLESTLLHTFSYVSSPVSSSFLPFCIALPFLSLHFPAVPASFPKENTPVRRISLVLIYRLRQLYIPTTRLSDKSRFFQYLSCSHHTKFDDVTMSCANLSQTVTVL